MQAREYLDAIRGIKHRLEVAEKELEQARQILHIDDKEINNRAEKKLRRALEGKCVIKKN